MSEIHLSANLPHPGGHHHRRRRNPFVEVLKFLGIFAVIFATLTLIVMGPTFYKQLTYHPDQAAENTDLPATISNDTAAIENLVNFVDRKPVEETRPDSIVIPKINVDAPLVYPVSGDNVSILDAIKNGVAHYPETALPGRNGNVFVTGHSSYYWWNGGQYNNVFALLDKLAVGDLIYVYYKNDKYIYRVNGHKVVNPNQVEVLDYGTTPILSIMTCTPLGTNLRRLVVTADLIGRPPVENTDFKPFQEIPKLPVILPLY